MFSIAQSALADPGFTDADRAAARTVAYRRAHTPDLKVIARVSAIPHALRLTRTAPADEYFGNLKYSPLGVRNEVSRINKYLDKGWGTRMEGDVIQVDSAVEDWQKQYPHDETLPATLLDGVPLDAPDSNRQGERGGGADQDDSARSVLEYAASTGVGVVVSRGMSGFELGVCGRA